MTTPQELVAIPQPKPKPIVGNLPELDADKGVFRFVELAEQYGPIFRLQLLNRKLVVVQSQELVDELCDEERFDKELNAPLRNVRDFAGDGLFTAWTDEPNWQAAHRILMPAFGPASLRDMFDGMADIAEQLLLMWERRGPEHRIDVADDTTRLTLDTIALCSFSHRFNSFYAERMNPFVESMVRALVESGARAGRLPGQELLMRGTRKQYAADKELMHRVADQLIADRREHPLPEGRHDILDTMLTATDPKTGARLPDENVRYQLVTFLIAGHETTSGLLTFTLHELLRNPDVLAKAQAEVDRVLGTEAPRFEHLSGLGYLDQIFKESLRLWPTAPAFAVTPRADGTVLGGRYELDRDDTLLVVAPGLHRDPAVWGADAETFDPERFSFERAEMLPPNAWKPFGNGQRSCIGRGFALQEATLFLAMLLQRFDISAADPDYQLKIKQTLTIKPEGLYLHARRRDVRISSAEPAERATPAAVRAEPNGVPVRVLYGSNAGTAQAFAQRIANDATARGCTGSLEPLDDAVGDLAGDGVVVIVTASYEGQPPDNAREFVRWLREQPDGALDGVRYVVFGCGNTDWARTYQAVPSEVDEQLARAGAKRLVERGRADARGDFFGQFDDWYSGFWGPVAAEFGLADTAPETAGQLSVEFAGTTRDPIVRANDLQWGTVVENRELTDLAAGSKRHLEIALPEGVRYRAGDYLAVLPLNPPAVVARALSRFGLAHDDQVVLRGERTFLPTGSHVAAGELLGSYVELAQPATRRQIELLADAAACPPDVRALHALSRDADAHAEQVLRPRVTLLDLLERFPSCALTFGGFLRLLSPLTPRQYSISSSPRWNPAHATLTVAVLNEPARSGSGTYEGAASNHLAQARPGTKVAVTVRPSNVAFHPPESLETPLVLACAGSGIAPFRGFLQDRALAAREQGVTPAPALLFFGCHGPESDHLYREELAAWAADGVVDVRPAYSAEPVDGVRYVQDRLWADRADVIDLVERGATVFVCGDGQRMAPAVHRTCARIYEEATGATAEQAEQWMIEMERDHARYVADVFA
ncbi:bifunctional P-450/NADPH--P450 reductase [Saccharopolyspora gloriosae]|uniref:Bifunctional cytochrome P450/NADPH--P450 reductase n=1 Tax=Saccharopolyspora gloriosae TaxID=455344 RepID=A0A840NP20_9PSEU|nr:cytochrome P450 [Saccharopolyspora gloriosae]MBB5072851.1 cytochrome P450/NADPH-cytochrome P450 reductase [Saccharopolyspora gloriosae]